MIVNDTKTNIACIAVLACIAVIPVAGRAQTTVSMWTHAGPGPEFDAYRDSVKAFNAAHRDIKVELVQIGERSYGEQVSAAAAKRRLPCVLEFDGPSLYGYASSGGLISLDQFSFTQELKRNMLRTLIQQGSYNGRLYSVAQFDSGLAIWGNRSMLLKAGVRIPQSVKDAWDGDEFESALKKLKALGIRYPLDMKFNYGVGEWMTYGFAPIVQSYGGDLIDRRNYRTSSGVLNSRESIRALQALQKWVKSGYVTTSPKNDFDFVQKKAALSYVGHWAYNSYRKALGDDLVLIPMPRFGIKAVTGAGSWSWGISSDCKQPKAAAKVLEHLMSKEEVSRITDVNGAVPGLVDSIAESKNYGPGGFLRIYLEQIYGGEALIRPQTPAYAVITKAFYEAVNNIVAGADVEKELDVAAHKIDSSLQIAANDAAR